MSARHSPRKTSEKPKYKQRKGKKGKFNVRKLEWNKSLLCFYGFPSIYFLLVPFVVLLHALPWWLSIHRLRVYFTVRSFALITQINKKLFFMGKTKCSEFPSLPFFHFIPLLTFQARLQDHKITKVEFLSSILYLQIDDWRKIRMGNTWRSNRTDSEKQHLYFRIHTWDPFVALFIGILSHGDNRSRIAQFWRTLKSHFLFFFMGFFCWSPRKPHF